jgi:hypothetical protein
VSAKILAGFVYELIHYKTTNAVKSPSIHAAQGGANEHIDREKPVYPADIYRSHTPSGRAVFGAEFDLALMRNPSRENPMRQALARNNRPGLMTGGRYISQRLRYTLR